MTIYRANYVNTSNALTLRMSGEQIVFSVRFIKNKTVPL